ncbi:MAG: hypothetical protein KNN13_09360 [Hydrogenobacter thermophilus]|nr:hypothetical protein [Hydrogenobacter thermophilus]QWK19673.1 MAG: hypothetical protein KNN13_09360 [Hydrogenobacter thermophilus]
MLTLQCKLILDKKDKKKLLELRKNGKSHKRLLSFEASRSQVSSLSA